MATEKECALVLELFESSYSRVFGFVRKHADRETCEEIAQEVFFRLLSLPDLETKELSVSYLIKIADNIPGGRTICAFGEACSWPVQSFVAKFKDEFVAKGAADENRRAKEGKGAGPMHEMKIAASSQH